jgi:hypothetical protein
LLETRCEWLWGCLDRQNGVKKHLTLSHQEFIRRFAVQILPKRFVKIRHYGFLSSTWKRQKLKKQITSSKKEK